MATQEPGRSEQQAPSPAENTGAAGGENRVPDEAEPKRTSTRPISTRVSQEDFELIERAAERHEMKRSELIEVAVLSYIGKAHPGARKTRVVVPAEVRREVRSAQETMDQLTVAMNRVGRNLLVQLKQHWAGEPAAVDELEQANTQLLRMQSELDRVAGDLRRVMDRPEW